MIRWGATTSEVHCMYCGRVCADVRTHWPTLNCGIMRWRSIERSKGEEVSMTLSELLADIHALEEDLLTFERKYGVRSETFYAAYLSGEEPENEQWVLDFGEWASVYRTWLSRQADYRNEIQRLQRNAPSLTGLIQA